MSLFANNEKVVFKFLPKFEQYGFLENLYNMAFSVHVGNFKEIKINAHRIKGGSGYVGATFINRDCFAI